MAEDAKTTKYILRRYPKSKKMNSYPFKTEVNYA